ncbi:hypothetical protein [Asticcacaulis sp. EMRT-3]|uniref:hypothetical protein n=1 Tax=Asticcacaulis sp. EMRT-3 TaxID=3040349 RepID=UPI0024AE94D7|nr:hypothetical protein [Asticcacaulis sp. EMRT-3]MDI7775771.1 hypothetical protein [Asticcacaulis sp. EMRT-3]
MLLGAHISRVRLMTNNPANIGDLISEDIEVTEHLPLTVAPPPDGRAYLSAKRARMGHLG